MNRSKLLIHCLSLMLFAQGVAYSIDYPVVLKKTKSYDIHLSDGRMIAAAKLLESKPQGSSWIKVKYNSVRKPSGKFRISDTPLILWINLEQITSIRDLSDKVK